VNFDTKEDNIWANNSNLVIKGIPDNDRPLLPKAKDVLLPEAQLMGQKRPSSLVFPLLPTPATQADFLFTFSSFGLHCIIKWIVPWRTMGAAWCFL
jgi:hypothetical protein